MYIYLSNQIFAILQSSDLAGRSNGLCKLCLRVAISFCSVNKHLTCPILPIFLRYFISSMASPLNQVELKVSIFWTNCAKFSNYFIIFLMPNIQPTTLYCQSIYGKCTWHISPIFLSFVLVVFFSCPGQLNKWHCLSDQSLGSIKEWL